MQYNTRRSSVSISDPSIHVRLWLRPETAYPRCVGLSSGHPPSDRTLRHSPPSAIRVFHPHFASSSLHRGHTPSAELHLRLARAAQYLVLVPPLRHSPSHKAFRQVRRLVRRDDDGVLGPIGSGLARAAVRGKAAHRSISKARRAWQVDSTYEIDRFGARGSISQISWSMMSCAIGIGSTIKCVWMRLAWTTGSGELRCWNER